jgi:hypothetical protein
MSQAGPGRGIHLGGGVLDGQAFEDRDLVIQRLVIC